MGTKARPYYRVVVAKSTAARGGAFVEVIGTYNPIRKPVHIDIKNDRALHWLMSGAQPTETTAVLLKKTGVLEEFFAQRPNARANYKFLDKRTAAISKKSVVVEPPAPQAAAAQAPAAPEPAPVSESEPVAELEATTEAPAAEQTEPA